MLVPFRNGLLKYQSIGGNLSFPTFLSEQITGGTFNVTLNATTSSLVGLISKRDKEYVVNVNSTVNSAWSGLTNGILYYLFIDLNKRGQIVYTASTIIPQYGPTDPIVGLQVGQTFFNTTTNTWKSWTGGFWEEVDRLYVGRSNGSLTTHNTSGSFSASNYEYVAGNLILDANQKVIFKNDKSFLTTADTVTVNDVSISSSKFDFLIDFVEADSNIGLGVVCKRLSSGIVTPASPSDVGYSLLSITLEPATTGNLVDVLNNGVIANSNWTFSDMGSAVYVTELGTLVDYNPFNVAETPTDAPPVGRVVGTHSVYFYPPLSPVGTASGIGPAGPAGPAGPNGTSGADGETGWSPIMAIISDGARRVMQVFDWTGGTGTKPATGDYVGASGLAANIANAVDIRGEAGEAGEGGVGGGTFSGTWNMYNETLELIDSLNIYGTSNVDTNSKVGDAPTTEIVSAVGSFEPAGGISVNVPVYSAQTHRKLSIKWQDFVGEGNITDVYVAFMSDYSSYVLNPAEIRPSYNTPKSINNVFLMHSTSASFPNTGIRDSGFLVRIRSNSTSVTLYQVTNGVVTTVASGVVTKNVGDLLTIGYDTDTSEVVVNNGVSDTSLGNFAGLAGGLLNDCQRMDVSVCFISSIAGSIDTTDSLLSWLGLGVVAFEMPVAAIEVAYSKTALGIYDVDDAVLPVGAVDGNWYSVGIGGHFGTKDTLSGDYVKLISSMTDIIVSRLPVIADGEIETISNKTDNPEWYDGSSQHYPSVFGFERGLNMLELSIYNNLMCTCSGRNFARYFDDFINFTQSASLATTTDITIVTQSEILNTNFLGAVKIYASGAATGDYYYIPSTRVAPIAAPNFNMYNGGVLEFTCSVLMTNSPVSATSKYSYGISTLTTNASPVVSVEWNGTDSNFILRYGAFSATSTVTAADFINDVVNFKIVISYDNGVEVRLFINSGAAVPSIADATLTSMDSSLLLHEVYPYFGMHYDTTYEVSMTQVVDYIGLQAFTTNRSDFGFSVMNMGPIYPVI